VYTTMLPRQSGASTRLNVHILSQVLAESHMSIHTWPEFNFAAVDIFVCGQTGLGVHTCMREGTRVG
jgi:S-adenosylmethionine/arginine decarboxylase-like enzyme